MRIHMVMLLLTLTWVGSPVLAQLEWQKADAVAKKGLDDTSARFEFSFTNKGNYPVTVLRVVPSCSCTVVELSKTKFQPGESGKLAATVQLARKLGLMRKTVIVLTDDAAKPSKTLSMTIEVPQVLEVTSNEIQWQKGRSADRQSITVRVIYPTPVHIAHMTPASNKIKATLETVRDGLEYRLSLSPSSTTETFSTHVDLETDVGPPGARKVMTIHAAVVD